MYDASAKDDGSIIAKLHSTGEFIVTGTGAMRDNDSINTPWCELSCI